MSLLSREDENMNESISHHLRSHLYNVWDQIEPRLNLGKSINCLNPPRSIFHMKTTYKS